MTQHGDDAGQGTGGPRGRAGSTAVRIAAGAACVLVVGAVAAGIGVAANRADLTGASGGAGAGAGATLTPAASPSAPADPTASVTATPQASAAPTKTATPTPTLTPNSTEGPVTPEPEPSAPASPPATPIPTPSDVRTDAGPVAEQWLVAAEAEAATEDYSALATQAERDNALVWITQQHIIASCMAEQGHDYTWTAYWQRADDAEAEPSSGVAPGDEALALWGINLTSESQPYRWQDAGCHGLAVHVTGQDGNH